MRWTLIVMLGLLGGASSAAEENAPAPEKAKALPLLGEIDWAPRHKKAENLVFRSAEEMAKAWTADGGKKDAMPQRFDEVGEMRVFDDEKKGVPQLDFSKQMVLAVFLGEKTSGGYAVEVEKVLHNAKEQKIRVVCSDKQPEPGAMTTTVMTYPSRVIVVPKVEGEVEFKLNVSDVRIKADK